MGTSVKDGTFACLYRHYTRGERINFIQEREISLEIEVI